MKKNLIVSYPRCGQQWLELRLALMFYLHPEYGIHPSNRPEFRKVIDFSHCGFNYGTDSQSYFQTGEANSKARRIFTLVRDPKAVMTSMFHYVWGVEAKTFPGQAEKKGVPADLYSYVCSDFGTVKLANFLNGILDKIIIPGRGGDFIPYERMFNRSFIGSLPHIAGVNIKLSDYEKDLIYRASDANEIRKFDRGERCALDELPEYNNEVLHFIKQLYVFSNW